MLAIIYILVCFVLGQLWQLISSKSDSTQTVRPGSSSGFLVNKRFPSSDPTDKSFQDPELKKSMWTVPSHKKKSFVEKSSEQKNLAVSKQKPSMYSKLTLFQEKWGYCGLD